MALKDLLGSKEFLTLDSQFPKKGRRKEKLIATLMANKPYPLNLSGSPVVEVVCAEQGFIERYTNHEPDIKSWMYYHLDELVSDPDIRELFGIEGDRLDGWSLSELVLRTQIALYDGWHIVSSSGRRIKGSDDCVDAGSLRGGALHTASHKLQKEFSIQEQYPYPVDYAKTILHFIRWEKPDKPPLWKF